jgi:pteridine reductase
VTEKVALVTGGAVRLGRAIALEMASSGYTVAVHYHGSGKEGAGVVAEIESRGGRAAGFRADLSRPAQIDRLIDRVITRFGRLDAREGSAANFLKQPLARTDAKIWDEAMDLNARANFLLARAAEKELRRRRGRVVLISDLAAHRFWREYWVHSISKAALETTVRVLARALAPEVSVNGIAPGTILPPASMPKAAVDRLVAQIPFRRCGSAEEIAKTVRFFCEGPAYITGQILIVDGGRSLI